MSTEIDKAAARAQSRAQRDADIELLQFCLGVMHPGQDVQIVFRTTKHRDFSGYWVWNLTELRHISKPIGSLRSDLKGEAWKEYHKQIAHRRWKWRDIEVLADKIRTGRLKPRTA